MSRSQLADLESYETKGDNKRVYNVRDKIVKPKSICNVNMGPALTTRLEPVPEGDLCSKGVYRSCRHSNMRVISRIEKIKEIIEMDKIDEEKKEKDKKDAKGKSESISQPNSSVVINGS